MTPVTIGKTYWFTPNQGRANVRKTPDVSSGIGVLGKPTRATVLDIKDTGDQHGPWVQFSSQTFSARWVASTVINWPPLSVDPVDELEIPTPVSVTAKLVGQNLTPEDVKTLRTMHDWLNEIITAWVINVEAGENPDE